MALPADERAVLKAIDARLRMGLRQYGKLDIAKDPRRWTKEALEEALDLAVYLACALMRQEKSHVPRKSAPPPDTRRAQSRIARRARAECSDEPRARAFLAGAPIPRGQSDAADQQRAPRRPKVLRRGAAPRPKARVRR